MCGCGGCQPGERDGGGGDQRVWLAEGQERATHQPQIHCWLAGIFVWPSHACVAAHSLKPTLMHALVETLP